MTQSRGRRRLARAGALLAAVFIAACSGTRRIDDTRERAYRANNVGVALLEQLKYPDAAAAFQNALSIDPTLAIGHFNMALALLYEQDLDGSAREANTAARGMPDAPQPPYVLGLIARAQNQNDAARGYFDEVRRIDPSDVGANVNLAQVDLEDRRYSDAVTALRPIVASEPYHITAAYVLGLALTRNGDTDEGQRLLERAQNLRRANYAVTFGTGYLEQGRYAEAIASTGAEPELVDQRTPPASFTASAIGATQGAATAVQSPFGRRFQPAQLTEAGARDIASGLGGGAALVDVDGDGDLDLVLASATGQRLLRHDANEAWTDATSGSGLESVPANAVAVGVVSADFDNDGAPDVFVLRAGQSSLYKNDGHGHFTDVTVTAGIPPFPALPGAAAFVDVDHDGDVDLVIGGLADLTATAQRGGGEVTFPSDFAPALLQLLRNNGNGTFTDITREAKLDAPGHTIAIVPTDYDNHRDIDLLIANADGPPRLFANQRDGTFRDVAADVGLSAVARAGDAVSAVAVGDVNKDDWPDFLFARPGGSVLALSDGRGRFTTTPLPASLGSPSAAQLIDYDNDGLLDIVSWSADGPRVLRNLGRSWGDVTASAFAAVPAGARVAMRAIGAADVDRDGDLDLVTVAGGAATLWRDSGDPRNKSLRVQLRGRVTNRPGIGSKVQVRAGSLSGRFETSASWPSVAPTDIVFGLGARPGAEVVRILWPSGILQAETAPGNATTSGPAGVLPSPFLVEELDRKPSSCPFLFAWNGERFEFITDFLGGGEMGDWEGPGAYNHPDPLEYVRIRGDQLQPSGDHLSIRITNELEEVLYLDRVQLLAVDHPKDLQIFPNEGMTDPPKAFRMHAVRDPRPPARVVDDHGHDVTDRIATLDRRYPDDFPLKRIRGYADMHSLTIDLGKGSDRRTLLLTGWTDYAFSSDNVAAQQSGLSSTEPVLEAHELGGDWRTLPLAVGIPVGRPQTIPLDLSGQLRAGEHELRLTTNMRIYWDQMLVGDTAATSDLVHVTTMEPRSAMLRARGFSAEVRPDGHEPTVYDYGRTSPISPWKLFTGSYTHEGDVLGLLTASDDRFAIGKPGDEIALEFAASDLRPLPGGSARTFLLKGDGFSKEMDVNSASPYTVEPLPFHAMTRYPYPSGEHYPDTPEYDRYRAQFNTRAVVRSVPSLRSGALIP